MIRMAWLPLAVLALGLSGWAQAPASGEGVVHLGAPSHEFYGDLGDSGPTQFAEWTKTSTPVTAKGTVAELPDEPSVECSSVTMMADGTIEHHVLPCTALPQDWRVIKIQQPKYRFSFIGLSGPIHSLSWGETAKSKTFWIAHGIAVLSIAADEDTTLRAERHGCLEHGDVRPYHTTLGRMGTVDGASWLALTTVDFFLRKAGIPIAPYTSPLVMAAKHGLYVYDGTQTPCL